MPEVVVSATQYLLEVASFARLGESREGIIDFAAFERAAEGLPQQQGQQFSWSARGELELTGRRLIHLHVTGYVMLECQRCLALFKQPIEVQNTFELVDTEAELELDEEDFESSDRILSTQRLDLFELIEDEVILSLPYVARHEVCPSLPDALVSDNDEPDPEADKPNPFAVLSKLKKQ